MHTLFPGRLQSAYTILKSKKTPGALAGPVSVTLLATLPKQASVILLGAFVTGYGVYRLVAKNSAKSVPRWWGIPTGLVGGLVGGLFGADG